MNFILENMNTIVTIAILVINVILLGVNIVKSIIVKSKKIKTEIEEEETKSENGEDFIEIIRNVIPTAIVQAENSGVIGGANKKLLALSQILLECSNKEFDYKKNASLIGDCLEELISFSKKVNNKKEGVEDD